MTRRWTGWTWLAALALSLSGAQAKAAASEWWRGEPLSARLIAATDAVGPGSSRVSAGLQVEMAEGWKIYWRSPGEVGLPPEFDWSAAENVADAQIVWPAPTRFDAFGIENYGYDGEVVLPLEITLATPGAAARLAASVDLLACSHICVPVRFDAAIDLPAGAPTVQQDAARLIATHADRAPVDAAAIGATLTAAAGADAVTLAIASPLPFTAPDVFIEAGEGVAFGRPDIRLSSDGRTLWARAPVTGGAAAPGAPVRVTVTGAAQALQIDGALDAAPPAPPFQRQAAARPAGALALTLLGALLGGFILNAMPCVLPVLSLKVGSALQARGEGRARARAGFLATAAGIVVSMWVVAAGVLAAQGLGVAVGWGLQFQNPVFVALMAAVATLFAANMVGLFEIPLPASVATRAAEAGGRRGLAGDFATGAFATLMATPCSAPFLGAAVAFALTGGALDVVLIFTALGVGLALPYLALAARPGAIEALPRPGPWMLWLKAGLGALLGLTALWLLWVLAGVAGAGSAWAAAAALAAALALMGLRRLAPARAPRAAAAAAALCVLASVAAPAALREAPGAAVAAGEAVAWASFDRGDVARRVARGEVVLVDVTADWCLTCKANKALVLDRDPVAGLLRDGAVSPVRADWTRPDDRIARYLADNGRYGIPFNAVYGPAAPEGVLLPELLTTGAVLDAVTRARGAAEG